MMRRVGMEAKMTTGTNVKDAILQRMRETLTLITSQFDIVNQLKHRIEQPLTPPSTHR